MNKTSSIVVIITTFFIPVVMSQTYIAADVAIKFTSDGTLAKNLCESIVVEQGDVLILASKFSSKMLEQCLIDINKSGRRIFLILDSKFVFSRPAKVSALSKAGVCVYSDFDHNTAHNKVVISGNKFVFTGSYNFTDDSEHLNSENGVFIRSSEVNEIYRREFAKHLKHSSLIPSKYLAGDQCSKH